METLTIGMKRESRGMAQGSSDERFDSSCAVPSLESESVGAAASASSPRFDSRACSAASLLQLANPATSVIAPTIADVFRLEVRRAIVGASGHA
jgi:hypothetical protein